MTEYIDRQAVREILYNHYSRDVYTHEGIVHKVTAEIDVDELNSIPAADVRENNSGHWVEYPVVPLMADASDDEYIGCSECGAVWDIICNETERFVFCPKCGAYMRGKKDG